MRINEDISNKIESYLKEYTNRVPNQAKRFYIKLSSFTKLYNQRTNSKITTKQMWLYLEDMRYYITKIQ